MAGFTGRSPVFYKTTFSVAIPFLIQTRWERFFIYPFCNHFVTTSGNPTTVANHGPVCRERAEAISNGLRLIGPPGQVMDFSTSFGRSPFPARPANSAVPQMAA